MSDLTLQSLNLLLAYLDSDPLQAAEKYEILRLKLIKCLLWKGCDESKAEALADIIIDRVAAKLAEGVDIKNLNAYACQVLRFVWLEHRRKDKEDGYEDDKMPEIEVEPVYPEDPDLRLACLRTCLAGLTEEKRELILRYYNSDEIGQDKSRRKSIAERLGIKMNALKARVFHLREKLEKCINECVKNRISRVTDS